jgi:hypothetical protein
MDTLNISDREMTWTLPRVRSMAVISRRRSDVSRITLPEPSAIDRISLTESRLRGTAFGIGSNNLPFNLPMVNGRTKVSTLLNCVTDMLLKGSIKI